MRSLIPIGLLAGCATVSADTASQEADLAQELAGRTAGAAAECIDTSSGQALDIASANTLVVRQGRTIWVNRLPSACPGLRPMDQLVVEPAISGRYCRNDRFRSVQPGSSVPGAYCRFGRFTPYRRP